MSKLKTNKLQHTAAGASEFTLPTADGNDGQFIKTNGSGALSFATVTTAPSAGETIETLTGICDGRNVTVTSGTYTLPNVTAVYPLTTAHTVITGSSIGYTPPSGTKTLIYKFITNVDITALSGISHYQIQVDGTTIIPSRISKAGEYVTSHHHHSQLHMIWIFDLTETSDDIANGKIAGSGWTSNKTIRVTGREYSGSYAAQLHSNKYWDGATASGDEVLIKPNLTIQAIA